jgi:hypothetical protein
LNSTFLEVKLFMNNILNIKWLQLLSTLRFLSLGLFAISQFHNEIV